MPGPPRTPTRTRRRARGADRGRRAWRGTDLADRFPGTLEFGTAGLRGALGAGPNRMNRVVVTRAAAGLVAYLTDTGAPRAAVVIGYDARHNSDVFARDTAEIMTGRRASGARPCPGRCRPRCWRTRSASWAASPA